MEVKIKITDQQIAYTLVSGLEGGIGYWGGIHEDREVVPRKLKFRLDKKQIFAHIDYPMNKGGAIFITDYERGEKPRTYKLTLERLHKAVKLMAQGEYKHHFMDIVNEGGDATTGDVLVQLAIFGDVIYG